MRFFGTTGKDAVLHNFTREIRLATALQKKHSVAILAGHHERKVEFTMYMHRMRAVRQPSRYGILALDDQSKVLNFSEKPYANDWISGGYFVFNRRVFDYLGGDECFLEREPLSNLAHDGELMAYKHNGFFWGMDTYRDYKYLNELWGKSQTPWKQWK